MIDTPSLGELERQAEECPERIDVDALCRYIGSDDHEQRNHAQSIRDTVIETAPDLRPFVDILRDLLGEEDAPPTRVVGETLSRVVRVSPDDLTPLVAVDLDAENVHRRAIALSVIGNHGSGVVYPHRCAFVEHLDDPDPRVAALALAGLSSLAEDFPEAVTEHVQSIRPYLADEWIPDDGGGMRAVYSRTESEGDTGRGEASGERLTNGVVRPYDKAVSLVEAVALTHPDAVESVRARIESLVGDPPRGADLTRLLTILTRMARADPEDIEGVVPAVEQHADAENRRVRIAARNLLSELGRPVDHPDPIRVPDEMASRIRPEREADAEHLRALDERACFGDVDVDAILPVLRSADEDRRDHTAWGLSCGTGTTIVHDVHERGTDFLALLDEPHDCTRRHLLELLGDAVRQYPEEWVPPLVELASHDDANVRRSALSLLGTAASGYPSLVRTHLELVETGLHDADAKVRTSAIFVLRQLAVAYPELVAEHIPAVVAALDEDATRESALRAIRTLVTVDPTGAVLVTDPVVSLVETLAGPTALDDRARWGRKGHTERDDTDYLLKLALSVCFWLAKIDPSSVGAVKPHAERITRGRYYGHEEARKLVAQLDAT